MQYIPDTADRYFRWGSHPFSQVLRTVQDLRKHCHVQMELPCVRQHGYLSPGPIDTCDSASVRPIPYFAFGNNFLLLPQAHSLEHLNRLPHYSSIGLLLHGFSLSMVRE